MTVRSRRIGLKLWSPNVALAGRAAELHSEGWIDLIELYVVPGSFETTIGTWGRLGVPFMLHCPHAAHKFNLARPELRAANVEKFAEVRQFADALAADVIVTHGGNRGEVAETIRQLRDLADHRIHLENKPKVSLSGGRCIGHSPEEVSEILSAAGLSGFVLDFGHATCAANSAGVDPVGYIEQFVALGPSTFHIGDGDGRSERDTHLHLGQGTFDLARFVSYVPPHSTLTIETPTDLEGGLDDYLTNVRYLRQLLTAGTGALHGG